MHDILIGSQLFSILDKRVNLKVPNTEEYTKRGDIRVYFKNNQRYVTEPAIQIALSSLNGREWLVSKETHLTTCRDDYTLTFNDALAKLVEMVVEFANGSNIRFHIMRVPAFGVESSNTEIYGRIIVRHIKDYMPSVDALVSRFDIVITKEPE